jgi:hypothetical protein
MYTLAVRRLFSSIDRSSGAVVPVPVVCSLMHASRSFCQLAVQTSP